MGIALVMALMIVVSLGYAAHGITLLRWCGLWSRNRRLVLWVSQMLFPFLAAPILVTIGSILTQWCFGDQGWLGWGRRAPVDVLRWASWLIPSFALATAGFLVGPACVLGKHWKVWAAGMLGVATAWAAALSVGLLQYTEDVSSVAAIIAWHIGAIAAPLAIAWRIRAKRKRSLGGRACLDCGYDLAGVTLDRCPECGAKR